jgi:hypothetical protein
VHALATPAHKGTSPSPIRNLQTRQHMDEPTVAMLFCPWPMATHVPVEKL